MTTYGTDTRKCACCGHSSEVNVLASTSSFGSPDIDLRPPPLHRFTMDTWVECCDQCGYCAKDIRHAPEQIREIVESPDYRSLINNATPSLVLRFLRTSYIHRSLASHAEATHYLRIAVWAGEDAQMPDDALNTLRVNAAEGYKSLRSQGGWSRSDPGVLETVTADLFRRAGRWDDALELANEGLLADVNENVRKVLEFEISLINSRDQKVYKVSDAIK